MHFKQYQMLGAREGVLFRASKGKSTYKMQKGLLMCILSSGCQIKTI